MTGGREHTRRLSEPPQPYGPGLGGPVQEEVMTLEAHAAIERTVARRASRGRGQINNVNMLEQAPHMGVGAWRGQAPNDNVHF